jgi:hypothetical protein
MEQNTKAGTVTKVRKVEEKRGQFNSWEHELDKVHENTEEKK